MFSDQHLKSVINQIDHPDYSLAPFIGNAVNLVNTPQGAISYKHHFSAAIGSN